jgi:hypothetical protein
MLGITDGTHKTNETKKFIFCFKAKQGAKQNKTLQHQKAPFCGHRFPQRLKF